jgi:hypothetical protein
MADSSFDDFDSGPPPEESNNRTFVIVAGILGGIILLSVACVAALVLFNGLPTGPSQADSASGTATAQAANAFINQALTATFEASILPTTTSTPLPTATSVVALASSTLTPDPALSTANPITATVAAALTQAAAAQLTIVPTSTALPNTGFADEYGLPGMFVMALAFMIVILLSRRLRAAPTPDK